MADRTGSVWFGNRLVGRLREDEESDICFAYDPGWLDGTGFPISISLPLSYGEEEVKAHAWFTGLLPEGRARRLASNMNGINEEDSMGLLLSIGEDCAGALSILPSDASLSTPAELPRSLTIDELISLVNSAGEDMPTFPDGGVRFSLSGAQNKLAVIYDNGNYSLSTRTSPSSHILKFETKADVCFAESITHAIATETGLPVVDTKFMLIGDGDEQTPWLRISRYDRGRDKDGAPVRIHQEDMLQALRLDPVYKYSTKFGPSIKALGRLLRSHSAQPIDDLSTLLDWQILNCLLGNWDGHAKNLSLLYLPGKESPMIAPCYDMVSIEYLNLLNRLNRKREWSRDMGLAVGEQVIPERITRADWEQMAKHLNMPAKSVLARLEEKATDLPDVTGRVLAAFMAQHGEKDDYKQICNVVNSRCSQVLNSVFRPKAIKANEQEKKITENKIDTESRKSGD